MLLSTIFLLPLLGKMGYRPPTLVCMERLDCQRLQKDLIGTWATESNPELLVINKTFQDIFQKSPIFQARMTFRARHSSIQVRQEQYHA